MWGSRPSQIISGIRSKALHFRAGPSRRCLQRKQTGLYLGISTSRSSRMKPPFPGWDIGLWFFPRIFCLNSLAFLIFASFVKVSALYTTERAVGEIEDRVARAYQCRLFPEVVMIGSRLFSRGNQEGLRKFNVVTRRAGLRRISFPSDTSR